MSLYTDEDERTVGIPGHSFVHRVRSGHGFAAIRQFHEKGRFPDELSPRAYYKNITRPCSPRPERRLYLFANVFRSSRCRRKPDLSHSRSIQLEVALLLRNPA